MTKRLFKVHTNNIGRLCECIYKAMYGVSKSAITKEMPKELLSIREGDIVFISEKEISNNALFGPFYVVSKRPGIIPKSSKGLWTEIDTEKSLKLEVPYWAEIEKMNWCISFDKTLIDKISVVWPKDWRSLNKAGRC